MGDSLLGDMLASWTIEIEVQGQHALERIIAIFRVRGLTIRWLEYQPGGTESSGVIQVSTVASWEQAERVLAFVERVVAVTTVRMRPAGAFRPVTPASGRQHW